MGDPSRQFVWGIMAGIAMLIGCFWFVAWSQDLRFQIVKIEQR